MASMYPSTEQILTLWFMNFDVGTAVKKTIDADGAFKYEVKVVNRCKRGNVEGLGESDSIRYVSAYVRLSNSTNLILRPCVIPDIW